MEAVLQRLVWHVGYEPPGQTRMALRLASQKADSGSSRSL